MSATIQQVFNANDMELRFSTHYSQKDFMRDASRLKALARKKTREALTAAELAEVPDLRRRIKRVDSDSVLLLIIESRLRGGYNFF